MHAPPDTIDTVTVGVRGRMTAAEHVYAHDRIAALRRLVEPTTQVRSKVSVDLDARRDPRERVLAQAEVCVGAEVVTASAQGSDPHGAIDALEARLREGIMQCVERA
jgi:ribosome-associated translation inhibitor RaiA